jgi:hypothetical protein
MLYWSVGRMQAVSAISTIVVALPAGYLSEAPPGTIAVVGGRHALGVGAGGPGVRLRKGM